MPKEVQHNDLKIIVIGLNKTGTVSLHQLFEGSGITSAHWRDSEAGNLAKAMLSNMAIARDPLYGVKATAVSDMSYAHHGVVIEGSRFFRELHAAYPDAYFILNTRPINDWLDSRFAHAQGSLAQRTISANRLEREQLAERWRRLYWDHREEVLWHFADSDRFLMFDIVNDDPKQIQSFLAPHFDIDLAFWGQKNARATYDTSRAAA